MAELRGVPKGFTITVNEVRLSAGAGLIVMLCGSIVTMPGLPRVSAAELMQVDSDGQTISSRLGAYHLTDQRKEDAVESLTRRRDATTAA